MNKLWVVYHRTAVHGAFSGGHFLTDERGVRTGDECYVVCGEPAPAGTRYLLAGHYQVTRVGSDGYELAAIDGSASAKFRFRAELKPLRTAGGGVEIPAGVVPVKEMRNRYASGVGLKCPLGHHRYAFDELLAT